MQLFVNSYRTRLDFFSEWDWWCYETKIAVVYWSCVPFGFTARRCSSAGVRIGLCPSVARRYRERRAVPLQELSPASPLGIVYRMTCVLPLLLGFFIFKSLLALRAQNRWMDGSWLGYDELGYGVILIYRDWIRRIVPLFLGRWGNCPKFRQKYDDALIRRLVVTERRNIGLWKRENIFKGV